VNQTGKTRAVCGKNRGVRKDLASLVTHNINLMTAQLQKSLKRLEALEKSQVELAEKMIEAYDGAIYAVDLFISGALNRSLALSDGFKGLVKSKNLICAAAILRLQIDTAIRFFAGTLVDDTNQFVSDVLKGKHIRNLKDRNGNKMTDRYLVEELSDEYPWLPNVYEKTSSYIHLSDTHLFASVQNVEKDKRTLSLKISAVDRDEIPEKLYNEAVEAFNASTEIIVRFVNGWIFTKSNPEIAAKIKTESIKRG